MREVPELPALPPEPVASEAPKAVSSRMAETLRAMAPPARSTDQAPPVPSGPPVDQAVETAATSMPSGMAEALKTLNAPRPANHSDTAPGLEPDPAPAPAPVPAQDPAPSRLAQALRVLNPMGRSARPVAAEVPAGLPPGPPQVADQLPGQTIATADAAGPAPGLSQDPTAGTAPAAPRGGVAFADLSDLPRAEDFMTGPSAAAPPTLSAGQSLETSKPLPKVPSPSLPPTDGQVGKASGTDDPDVARAACTTCGAFHSSLDGPAFHESFGCADGQCVPGRAPCNVPCHNCDNFIGAFINNLYMSICCPDPCYQPKWEPAANASLFADYARPRTVTRIRYDNLINIVRPDRNQFFVQTVHQGKNFKINGTTYRTDPSVNLQQLYFYQEAAGERGSFFVEIPYRQLDPLFSPTQAGFSDINFGIKSLMFDTEMLQVSSQLRTYTPSGNAMQGLGTGHFSLDPSILLSLKLGPETYFQSQIGNWIPLGGTAPIAGGVLYWFNSLNQVLLHCTPDSPLIGTLEMDGWSFENGGWTKPIVTGAPGFRGAPANVITSGGGVSYFNMGPGLRLSICNKIDIGSAITWSTTAAHWGNPWYRFEVRFLF